MYLQQQFSSPEQADNNALLRSSSGIGTSSRQSSKKKDSSDGQVVRLTTSSDKSQCDPIFLFQSSRAFSPSLAPPSSGEHSIEDANGQVESVKKSETERGTPFSGS